MVGGVGEGWTRGKWVLVVIREFLSLELGDDSIKWLMYPV